MNTPINESRTIEQLTFWFIDRLDRSNIQLENEPLSYDGNTPYDVQFYQLQTEAAHHWQKQYGYVPTPGQLMKGFFGAEFERSRRLRLANRTWLGKLQAWYRRAITRSYYKSGTRRFLA